MVWYCAIPVPSVPVTIPSTTPTHPTIPRQQLTVGQHPASSATQTFRVTENAYTNVS